MKWVLTRNDGPKLHNAHCVLKQHIQDAMQPALHPNQENHSICSAEQTSQLLFLVVCTGDRKPQADEGHDRSFSLLLNCQRKGLRAYWMLTLGVKIAVVMVTTTGRCTRAHKGMETCSSKRQPQLLSQL